MAVYVDYPLAYPGKGYFCHMVADTVEELHAMAREIGVRRCWFEPHSFPHYDLRPEMWKRARNAGAKLVSSKELGLIIREVRGLSG